MKKLPNTYFPDDQSYLKDRMQFLKRIMVKELISIGCGDFDFEVYTSKSESRSKYSWFSVGEIDTITVWFNFTFKNEKWRGTLHIPTCYKYCYHARQPEKLYFQMISIDENYFFINDIRSELGKKFMKKYTRMVSLPIYESLRPTYEHLKSVFEDN